MAIDIDVEITAGFFKRWMTVQKLLSLLGNVLVGSLMPGDELQPNAVGNLAIVRDGAYIWYVDFAAETVDLAADVAEEKEL